MRRTILFIGLGCWLGLAACRDDAPIDTPKAVATIDTALRSDEQHVYAVEWETEATAQRPIAMSGGVHLRGEIVVRAIGSEEGGVRVQAWFRTLPVREIAVGKETVALDAAQMIGPRAEIVLDASGDPRSIVFDETSTPAFRELMTGVLGRLDFRAAAATDASRVVRTGHGLTEVAYARNEAGEIERTFAKAVRIDTVADPGEAPELTAEGTIAVDDAGLPLRIALVDTIAVAERGLTASDRFSAERKHVERADANATPIAGGFTIDPHAPPDTAASAKAMAQQRAEGLTHGDIALQFMVSDVGTAPKSGFVSRAVGYLRGWPERTPEVEALAYEAVGFGRQIVFDLLATADTPESQAALVRLVESDEAAQWEDMPILLQRFTFLQRPTPATARALLDWHARAGESELGTALLYPIGTLCDRVEDAALSTEMHELLVRELESTAKPRRLGALAGLGNAGRMTDAGLVLAHAADVDVEVRAQVFESLRRMPTSGAQTALLVGLKDADSDPAASALRSLLHHYELPISDAPLVEAGRTGAYHPKIERAVANALSGAIDRDDVRVALTSIAERTTDAQLRSDIRARLES